VRVVHPSGRAQGSRAIGRTMALATALGIRLRRTGVASMPATRGIALAKTGVAIRRSPRAVIVRSPRRMEARDQARPIATGRAARPSAANRRQIAARPTMAGSVRLRRLRAARRDVAERAKNVADIGIALRPARRTRAAIPMAMAADRPRARSSICTSPSCAVRPTAEATVAAVTATKDTVARTARQAMAAPELRATVEDTPAAADTAPVAVIPVVVIRAAVDIPAADTPAAEAIARACRFVPLPVCKWM